MKKIFSALAAYTSVIAFILFLKNCISGMSKTLSESPELSDSEKAILAELTKPEWGAYFLSYITLLIMLLAAVFLTVAIFRDKGKYTSLSHIFQPCSALLLFIVGRKVISGESNLLYDRELFLITLLFSIASYCLLLIYSALVLTKNDIRRFL